ncbi:tRNA 4-thiouridine(8) synthase ThiI [Alicyclobacillus fastidiosus]|uniref:Probable tRNA sulfurtransferase n=1 Tax=Alicyclobacillus fastidiosus TaxID=392011 RepID=A0ABY6ZCE2_9BACL|nr:tRNA uracil 4-sulfurtransferase ThiI [Alicyclobacillus fastidiosus]WAH40453.1 tRNA 4-thiouridine(8) synthase ThiI [Alicyclobacillus fastidiosus]GMA61856.1 putative tRNA sulfurtransferase [Alicyclobacillus fastidiosus]
MFDHILVRYGEINTKGQNRSQLEQMLMRNVQQAVRHWDSIRVRRISNRILVKLNGAPVDAVLEALVKVFGISSLSPVMVAPLDVDAIVAVANQLLDRMAVAPRTFKVEVRRGNKRFPMDSPTLTRHVGAALLASHPSLTVDVHQPEATVQIDVRDEGAFLYAEKIPGAAGLPVGMSGRVCALLSGGIDSPVAVWKAMKRGLKVDLVHFHSFPFTSERAQRKVEELTSTLASWSTDLNLHLVSLTQTQAAIQKSCPEQLRTIILRRMMFRICEAMARTKGWLALVTGDSLGQVASQTLEGIFAVDSVTSLSVLRPVGMEDKQDIIDAARHIGTFETSIQPYDDCCSLFAPKRPKTHPSLAEVVRGEDKLDVEQLIETALQSVETKKVAARTESPMQLT